VDRHGAGLSKKETLAALLPKKYGTTDLKDFRPISLVHNFARLLTKVLKCRFSPKMADLVDYNQGTFICGRCIHEKLRPSKGVSQGAPCVDDLVPVAQG
jgi:hypothetical protein